MDQKRTKSLVFGRRFVVGICVLAGITAWFTYASIHAYAPNADGATVVLEGSAIVHGQPLLNGWSLSLDSFWSVDSLFYALGVAAIGVKPILMHFIPALLAALCVWVGWWIACSGETVRLRIFATGLIVAAMCLPGHTAAFYLLQGPWHVATTLYCLVAVLLLARPSFGFRWAIAVLLLALGLTGDLQMLAIGVVPIAVAGLFAMARQRSLFSGLTQIAAAVVSCVLALVIRAIADVLGTFGFHESHHTVKLHQLLRDIGHFGNWISALFGVHSGPIPGPSIPPYVEIARAMILALVVVGVVIGFVNSVAGVLQLTRRRQRGATEPDAMFDESGPEADDRGTNSWRIDDLLVCMTVGAVALFGLLTLSNNTNYARYLDPVVIFGAVLSARVGARLAVRCSQNAQRIFGGVLGVVLVLSLVGSLEAAGTRAPVAPTRALESYLGSHHLTQGIGDYWASSIVTVDTGQSIEIRPVVANLDGQIVPDGRQASIDWYKGQHFQFLVYERASYGRVDATTVRATFGSPARVVSVGRYYVVTWKHSLALHGQPFP